MFTQYVSIAKWILAACLSFGLSLGAQARAQGIFRPEKLKEVICLVRYHGFVKSTQFNPKHPDAGVTKYLATGENGDFGTEKQLTTVNRGESGASGDTVSALNWNFSQPEFGLNFTIEAGGNGVNSVMAWGELTLKVTDVVEDRLLGTTDVLLASLAFADNGSYVAQITVPLPERIVKDQLQAGTPSTRLLTQVKFQCN